MAKGRRKPIAKTTKSRADKRGGRVVLDICGSVFLRFRTHRNDNSEAPTWVRRGPCPARRLKALKASHVWAAGGARAQARRSTGDVLGRLPPEKSRGLRGGPAQRQRTEVGRIRSCCQGWTGLDDDCCEERGQVAPGGREGSGSTL